MDIETSVEHVRLAILQSQSDRLSRHNSPTCLEPHQQQLAFQRGQPDRVAIECELVSFRIEAVRTEYERLASTASTVCAA